jgi:hypothetical protein
MRNTLRRTQYNRRRVLISLIGSAPFAVLSVDGAAAIGGSATAPKVAQSAAGYRPTPREGQACAACYAFVAPHHCKFLAGEISPSGWCRLWKAKEDQEKGNA